MRENIGYRDGPHLGLVTAPNLREDLSGSAATASASTSALISASGTTRSSSSLAAGTLAASPLNGQYALF